MIKQYNSFKEIDYRLKILSLQREIDKENLKLNLKHSKNDLAFLNATNGFKSYLQVKMITKSIKYLRRLFKQHRSNG